MRKMLFVLYILFLFFPKDLMAQELNEYKYVIVPKKFGFFEEPDKYQLNSLTVFLFNKYGFEAFMEGETLPEDLKKNPCSALHADVLSDSGMFSMNTRVKVVLKNCTHQTLFESKEGRSKIKKYKFAYQEALRDAFSSVESLNHVYQKPSDNMARTEVSKNKTISKTPENPYEKSGMENILFEFNGNDYQLVESNKNLILKNVNSESTEANLYKTNTGSFVFRSEKINGTAYFDENENLVVEYFDEVKGSMEKLIYVKK